MVGKTDHNRFYVLIKRCGDLFFLYILVIVCNKKIMTKNKQVWVVDDDKSIRWVLEKSFQHEAIPVRAFESADKALNTLETSEPAIIFSDIRMPGTDGFEFLNTLQNDYPYIPVIIMTAYSDIETTVNAFQSGAFEYMSKPFDVQEVIEVAKRALEQSKHLQQQTEEEQRNVEDSFTKQNFIGQSLAIQKVFHVIGRLSATSISVLITGESGTGKELIAKALHTHSPRSKHPFIAINTAAIPAELLESELFGHEKGAFTGAYSKRIGRFEQADKGTLFLDEIGDMPANLQTRLLRVLADGAFYRIGGHIQVNVDVRIIAATNQNLQQRLHERLFREDLYHRLNVINIHSPALRERLEDIPLLLAYFLEKSAQELHVDVKTCTEEAIQQLQMHPWSGNIRQLENTARWLAVMVASKEVTKEDLPNEFLCLDAPVTSEIKAVNHNNWEQALVNYARNCFKRGAKRLLDDTTPRYERIMIQAALQQTKGKKKEAADLLGLGRNTLSRKIKELDI